MPSSSAPPPFAQVLNSITETKFSELTKKRKAFVPHLDAVRSIIDDNTINPRDKVRKIIEKNTATNPSDLRLRPAGDVKQYENLLRLSKYDPSISEEVIKSWAQKLSNEFEIEDQMQVYGGLFANLLKEWLSSGQAISAKDSDWEAVEKVGRKEMHDQRAVFEKFVFNSDGFDTDATKIKNYLDQLFNDSLETESTLEDMRERIKTAAKYYIIITESAVIEAMQMLLKNDLLSNDKQATVKEFLQNKVVLKEITDVIKIYFSSIDTWSWPEDGVTVEMRRQINGKYRVYMDEEIIQAIFLQCIGCFWCRTLYREFQSFHDSPAWKPTTQGLSAKESSRRRAFLKNGPGTSPKFSIDETRRNLQQEQFFLGQLRGETDVDLALPYDDDNGDSDDDEQFKKKLKAKGKKTKASKKQKKAPNLKQSLLHLMATEALLNVNLRSQHTIVRSDFEWFGPSLPHTSILTILEYFGVPERWIKFFRTFLEAPLKFSDDGPGAVIRTRSRGVPMSHALSTAFGETVLFCMDYAVNKMADGTFLYRIHDDLWFWNSDPAKCVKAWEAMKCYADVVGLKFNQEKTGSICIGAKVHAKLPSGSIKWGFLVLNSSGKFVIDQEAVNTHIMELRLQLAACKTVFSWVQAYNRYMRFFTTNFAAPAKCFGVEHVNQSLDTLRRIQKELFPDHQGSVILYLSSVIEQRFGVSDIPTGWFYWPVRLGGLELHNPFINLSAIKNGGILDEDPGSYFKKLSEKTDRQTYENYKREWNSSPQPGSPSMWAPHAHILTRRATISDDEEFFSFAEYNLGRESHCPEWADAFNELMGTGAIDISYFLATPDKYPELAPENKAEIMKVLGTKNEYGTVSIDCYWQWIMAIWGEEMVEKWGGYCIVRDELLPLGMVEVFRSAKVRWEQ